MFESPRAPQAPAMPPVQFQPPQVQSPQVQFQAPQVQFQPPQMQFQPPQMPAVQMPAAAPRTTNYLPLVIVLAVLLLVAIAMVIYFARR
jgi:hypothetical protein